MHRNVVAAVAVAVMMTTAGCGFILGNDPVEFSASPATVSDEAVDETGYEETNVSEQVISREFEVADQSREVQVTNQLAKYERQLDLPQPIGSKRGGVFVALASPKVEVLDQTFNPLDDMSERDILERFETQYEGITVGERVGTQEVSALGAERELVKFAGTATLAGNEVDVYIHAAKIEHGDDFIAVVAIYPQQVDSEEEGKVVTMMENLEHEEENQ